MWWYYLDAAFKNSNTLIGLMGEIKGHPLTVITSQDETSFWCCLLLRPVPPLFYLHPLIVLHISQPRRQRYVPSAFTTYILTSVSTLKIVNTSMNAFMRVMKETECHLSQALEHKSHEDFSQNYGALHRWHDIIHHSIHLWFCDDFKLSYITFSLCFTSSSQLYPLYLQPKGRPSE